MTRVKTVMPQRIAYWGFSRMVSSLVDMMVVVEMLGVEGFECWFIDIHIYIE
jgi:hypothetical protein